MLQNIKINHVEASSEIAIEIMKQKYRDNGWEDDVIDDILYTEDAGGVFVLKDAYQDQFNELYDVIYSVLEDIKY